MKRWTIAAVQMDCELGQTARNLEQVRDRLRDACRQGAEVVVFPECILTGYCYESKAEAWPHAEHIPGPSVEALAADCRQLGVWCVVGMLERGPAESLFNVA